MLLLVQCLRGRRYLKPTPFRYTLAIALFQTCGMVGLAQWALISGGAGKVAILSYTMPFWVVIFAALFLGSGCASCTIWRSGWPPAACCW